MFAALATTLVLTASPVKLTVKLEAGSFVGSVWAAESYRNMVYHLRDDTVTGLLDHGRGIFDSPYLIYGAPVLGPWMTLAKGGTQAKDDTWLLVTSGVLQAVGLSILTYQLVHDGPMTSGKPVESELQLSIAPYVAGRLGVALTLTGF